MDDDAAGSAKLEARRLRMVAELSDEGIGIGQSSRTTRQLVVEELVRARYVKVHEGIWPPYGAVIGDPIAIESFVGHNIPAVSGIDSIAPFANGIDTFLVRDPNNETYIGLWNAGPTDELSLLRMSLKTGAIVVQRAVDSSLKVIGESRIWSNAGYSWWSRPAARTRLQPLRNNLEIAGRTKLELLASLLDFTFHRLSPRGIGTTLVWDVTGSGNFPEHSLLDSGEVPPLRIDFRDEASLQMMATFLSVVDGACVIDSQGYLVRTQVKLNASDGAARHTKPEGGTRHSSAKRFSFDYDGVVVIVVSADGPVTLYSGGVASEVLRSEDAKAPLKSLDVSQRRSQSFQARAGFMTCSTCGKRLVLDVTSIAGTDVEHSIKCPVCDRPLPPVNAYTVSVRPAKPWSNGEGS